MTGKKRVGIICGGRSAEHEVSLQSAQNVLKAIDRNKYAPVLIGIDKRGTWRLCPENDFLENPGNPARIRLKTNGPRIALLPWSEPGMQLVALEGTKSLPSLDVVFPVLHGPLGEDGTIQGLFRLASLPFVGAGVFSSAAAMDKDMAKKILRDSGIPVANWITIPASAQKEWDYTRISALLGETLFVKPANLGSSVGVHKVRSQHELDRALQDAFQYDRKLIVEEFIPGREIECSVLGNDKPIASLAGEVVPRREFYSYEAKYIDRDGALLRIPAALSETEHSRVGALAVQAFQALGCEGMARVDFFLSTDGRLTVNELNTIPGFTRISMYPQLWEVSNISYSELIDRLIQLAIERFQNEAALKTSYLP